jgi:hypothetical protein
MLENKKILFIGPVFHDYHLLITNKLMALGAAVFFYPERDYSFRFKLINNFFNKYLRYYQKLHYNSILKKIKTQEFDYLFVIRGYMLSKEFLDDFRKMNPNAKLIMYQWDSNKTNPYSHLLSSFDRACSFDFEDCDKYLSLNYIPLFYTDDVKIKIKDENNLTYDFFFMGWFYPERYDAVIKFKEFALQNGYKLKAFLFMPFSSYIKERFRGNKLDMSVVSLTHMKRHEYLYLLNKTNIMVDASSPNQTGLAMRIIEALASGTKVLTNNYKIKDDLKIYNDDYIAFFDAHNPFVADNFVKSKVSRKIKNLLSIEEWLKTIFKHVI